MSKNLIIYYSRTGENYFGGEIKSIDKGNTEVCAEYIQRAVGGDLFQVETKRPYNKKYMKCIEEAKKELKNNERPKLKAYLDDISVYDNIFICGPCWWGTYPCAIFSLIERLNFEGKKVLPLLTHEGSGLGNSEEDIKKICKGAEIAPGLAIRGSKAVISEYMVACWAKEQIGMPI